MTSETFRRNPLFLRNQFEAENVFDMPIIRKDDISLENLGLIGYDKLNGKDTDRIVHFFLDDYKFQVLYNDPEPRIEKLSKYRAVLSPNFSVYTEMPLAIKIYNTFRSRWCGAFMQSKGLKVIPTVAWGDPNTFWFSFDGIEKGSIVAVSTLGVRKEKSLFLQGYNELLRRIKPKVVICYGKAFEEMTGKIIEIDYAETNNLSKKESLTSEKSAYIKKVTGYIITPKGIGSALGNGETGTTDTAGEHRMPDFPGWDPTKPPGRDFEWRGKGTPEDGRGNWFNPKTREWFHADLEHPEPMDPHWDYGYPGGHKNGYRIFSDGSYELKEFEMEDIYYG